MHLFTPSPKGDTQNKQKKINLFEWMGVYMKIDFTIPFKVAISYFHILFQNIENTKKYHFGTFYFNIKVWPQSANMCQLPHV